MALAGLLLAGLVGASPRGLAAEPLKIVVLGDSLSAGYGLPQEAAFTSQLEAALRADGYDVAVPNTGVSGETTAGGLARVDWLLGDKPDLMIVALGGNDFLRAIDPASTRANLDGILAKLQAKGVPALLAGMRAPLNLDKTYRDTFEGAFPALAEKYGVPLYPFFLEGVALDSALNQADGLHPTADGVAVMVRGILPLVKRTLDGLRGKAGDPGAATDSEAG